jgi:hypothetical protein
MENEAIQPKRGGRNGNVAPPAPKGNKFAVKPGTLRLQSDD